MFPRVFARLQTFKYIRMWNERGSLSVNRIWVVQNAYTSNSSMTTVDKCSEQDSGQSDLIQRKGGHHFPKLPTQHLFPSKPLTKSAQMFETIAAESLNDDGFEKAIEEFQKRDLKRLKLIDFVSTAVAYMDSFGVSKNLDIYNKLLDVFPKGRYHNRNVFDTLWTRYRPQIDLAIRLLTKMEENGVRPNVDTYDYVQEIFGEDSIPMNKVKRIVFWFDKFDLMYPHPLPQTLPEEKQQLFELAIKRMIGEEASISVYKENAIEYQELDSHLIAIHALSIPYLILDPQTFNLGEQEQPLIVGTESAGLSQLLDEYDEKRPLFVEGPFHVWLRKIKIFYYVLQADVTPHLDVENPIFAVCLIDSEGEGDVKRWITELQKSFPRLEKLNVIFNISSGRTERFPTQ